MTPSMQHYQQIYSRRYIAQDSLLRLPYGILKRLNFPTRSLQQASRQLVGVTSPTQCTFWNQFTSNFSSYHFESTHQLTCMNMFLERTLNRGAAMAFNRQVQYVSQFFPSTMWMFHFLINLLFSCTLKQFLKTL